MKSWILTGTKLLSDYPLPKLHKEIFMIYIYTGMLCVTAY